LIGRLGRPGVGIHRSRETAIMPANRSTPPRRGDSPRTYNFRFRGKAYQLTFEQAFGFGHTLLEGGHAQDAAKLFTALAKVPNRGPRAKIMLAQCQAALDNYAACHEILAAALQGEDQPVAEDLQAAFVYHKLGMEGDAVREVAKVVNKYKNLPTACLVLGDLFAAAGRTDKAVRCWKLAIRRDRRGGGVALTARQQLDRLDKADAERIAKRIKPARPAAKGPKRTGAVPGTARRKGPA
jgi:thioredoxin-like negative regulator of GroEL